MVSVGPVFHFVLPLYSSPPRFLLLANEMTVYSLLSWRSFIEVLGSIGPYDISGGTRSWYLPLTNILWTSPFNQFFHTGYNPSIQYILEKKDAVGKSCHPSFFPSSPYQVVPLYKAIKLVKHSFLLVNTYGLFPDLHVPGNKYSEDLLKPLEWNWLFFPGLSFFELSVQVHSIYPLVAVVSNTI